MKILITGAAGKTGRAIIQKVSRFDWSIRAWVRSAGTEIEGVSDYFVGEMQDPAAWESAYKGVDAVYHICPNMHPAEIEIGKLSIAAAKQAGVQQFVYHSVLHPQTEEMPHHWHKMRVEEMLLASGLPFTILQPTAYMQNLLPQLTQLSDSDTLSLPYPADTRLSLVDLEDVASAVAQVLQQPTRWRYATLELVGTKPLSQTAIAEACSAWLGREVQFREIELSDWETANQTLNPYAKESLLKMFRYYARYGLAGSPAVLSSVLGKSPRSFEAWLQPLSTTD